MGSSQSLFYPDNPHRHDRAEQLGNDCQAYQNEFNTKKASLEALLGPYKSKIDKVMAAFGCEDLDDLTRLIEQTGTPAAISNWNNVKNSYDKTQMVDQVIFGAMGIVAATGLTISIVGALAGGIGFFAGIAITGEILLALGLIGVIFDAISGAIIRDKLRDAINQLFGSRLKLKHVLTHLDNLFVWMPIIKTIYQVFEDAGYTQQAIIEHLKNKHFDVPVSSDMKDESFMAIAIELRAFDQSRGAWDNEDPDWQGLANNLQAEENASAVTKGVSPAMITSIGTVIGGVQAAVANAVRSAAVKTKAVENVSAVTKGVSAAIYAVGAAASAVPAAATAGAIRSAAVSTTVDAVPAAGTPVVPVVPVPLSSDTSIKVKFSSADKSNQVPAVLSGALTLSLVQFINTLTAVVSVKSEDKLPIGFAQGRLMHGHPANGLESEHWFISFADQADATRFGNPNPTPGSMKDIKVVVFTRAHHYLRADGALSHIHSEALRLVANYA